MVNGWQDAEVEIEFVNQEEEMRVIELVDFLQAMDTTYSSISDDEEIVADLLPAQISQEYIQDDEARDTLLGRLHRYGVLNDIKFRYEVHGLPHRYLEDDSHELRLKSIRKESPLLITLTGGGALAVILWLVEGVELEYEETIEVDDDGRTNKRTKKKFKFNATTTKELLHEIRQIFE